MSTETASVRLSPDLLERVDAVAAEEMRTRSGMVARLVAEGLQRREAADKEEVSR